VTNERYDAPNQNARSSFRPERANAERTFTCGARNGTQAFLIHPEYITLRLIHQNERDNEPMSQ